VRIRCGLFTLLSARLMQLDFTMSSHIASFIQDDCAETADIEMGNGEIITYAM
jgi:hypothetical protein